LDEEVFRDVPEEETAASEPEKLREILVHPDRVPKPARKPDAYDGRKRDPEHSNADKSCLWELLPFTSHFHPSVAMFSSRLLSSAEMGAKPDLTSHSLISFLDRFVYRNAKASSSGLKGSSIMQPLAGGDSRGVLVSNRATIHAHEPVNSEAFWRKKAEDVAVDEVFFHQYFSQVGKSKQTTAKNIAASIEDGSENGEDENEDEIWQALVDSRPEVEGPSDDDSDLDMLDIDDSDAEVSEGSGEDWEDDDEVDIEGIDEEQGSQDEEEPSPFLNEEDMDEVSDMDKVSDMDELFNKELQTNKKPGAVVDGTETGRAKKKKMKNLPIFASIEDYAEMLGGDEDEDMG